ncbi:MAG: hypothetical protein CMB99_01325 [Flavobacteriaceae bacterium]|nr:hypothetical protein [Flavobacteriaceae bacterium]
MAHEWIARLKDEAPQDRPVSSATKTKVAGGWQATVVYPVESSDISPMSTTLTFPRRLQADDWLNDRIAAAYSGDPNLQP